MKKNILIFTSLAAVALMLYTGCCPKLPCPCLPMCETFDAQALNQQYGKVGGVVANPPGSVIFSATGNVPVHIQNIDLSPSGMFFEFARVEAAPASFGSGQVVNTNNVCLEFDFAGKNVKEVSIEFLDLGGSENIFVNGAQVLVGEITTFGTATVGGVQVSVGGLATVPGGKKGKITAKRVTSDIKSFRVGGQEFYLDNLCYQ